MAYLHHQVQNELSSRIEDAGGWRDEVLYLGFHDPAPNVPDTGCLFLSPVEGDDLSTLQPGFDQVVINLQLAWLEHQVWLDWTRNLLQPGGAILFSSFGPDTLAELACVGQTVDTLPHVHAFTDMHHLGDAMLQSGFARVIVDAQWLEVEYEDVDLVMDDLRQEGFHNVAPGRRKTLTGRRRMENFRHCLQADSPVRVTFELIYGYAERPQEKAEAIRVALPTAPGQSTHHT